jgi:hypothetical protein
MREENRLREFGNWVLWQTCGPKRDGARGRWKRLYIEGLYDLDFTSNIVWVMKLRKMREARHVTRKGESRGAHRLLVGSSEGKRPLGRPNLDEREILKCILKTYD